jgi:uncharacterized membrane protein YcaP (DUF421 family)
MGLAETAGRAAVIYVLFLVTIRILGKRTIGNLSAFDMLIALVIGDLAGDTIFGDVSLLRGTLAVATIAGLHYVNSWLTCRFPRLGAMLEGQPTVIVKDGALVRAGLRRERMSEAEVAAELRLADAEQADVKLARVETDGRISVVR